jgi:hypothetical protein
VAADGKSTAAGNTGGRVPSQHDRRTVCAPRGGIGIFFARSNHFRAISSSDARCAHQASCRRVEGIEYSGQPGAHQLASCSTVKPCASIKASVQPSSGPGTKMRIHVEQHADHRGMPMPLKLHLGGHQVDVLEALDQWYGPDYRYIKSGAMTGACTSFASMSPALNGR